jgi:quinol monooxygenase YgiN
VTDKSEPLVVVAVFRARPEAVDELGDRLAEVVTATRQEAGCRRYDLHADIADPLRFVFVEEWADDDALTAHNGSEHLRALLADLPRLADGAPEVYRLRSFPH